MMDKLKKRWKLKTNLDVVAVFIVFAINGTLSTIITKPFYNFFNISLDVISPWLYYPIKIITTTIFYQLTFPIVGWLFGQFKFAWEFEKKFLSRLGLGFIFSSKKDTITDTKKNPKE